jgi:hypothetical protein
MLKRSEIQSQLLPEEIFASFHSSLLLVYKLDIDKGLGLIPTAVSCPKMKIKPSDAPSHISYICDNGKCPV